MSRQGAAATSGLVCGCPLMQLRGHPKHLAEREGKQNVTLTRPSAAQQHPIRYNGEGRDIKSTWDQHPAHHLWHGQINYSTAPFSGSGADPCLRSSQHMDAFGSVMVRLLWFLEECPASDYCCTAKEAGTVMWILPLGHFEQDQEIRIIFQIYCAICTKPKQYLA